MENEATRVSLATILSEIAEEVRTYEKQEGERDLLDVQEGEEVLSVIGENAEIEVLNGLAKRYAHATAKDFFKAMLTGTENATPEAISNVFKAAVYKELQWNLMRRLTGRTENAVGLRKGSEGLVAVRPTAHVHEADPNAPIPIGRGFKPGPWSN